MLRGVVALPTMTASATLAAGPSQPSDLARACLWATGHRAWIDAVAFGDDWDDDRVSAECRRVDDIITRAIREPSISLADLGAKARLALEDFERFTAVPGGPMDDGDRIVLTVLREAVALCA